jgi:hypothetical protein
VRLDPEHNQGDIHTILCKLPRDSLADAAVAGETLTAPPPAGDTRMPSAVGTP